MFDRSDGDNRESNVIVLVDTKVRTCGNLDRPEGVKQDTCHAIYERDVFVRQCTDTLVCWAGETRWQHKEVAFASLLDGYRRALEVQR